MPDKINKKDFIEIEFTGKTKDGEVFDSNINEDLKETNLKISDESLILSVGENMFLKAIDESFEGKNVGDEYEIELTPDKAFGKRNSKLLTIIPIRLFKQQNLNPVPGAAFNFDGRIGKIISVSGGRVIADFNNPLAGKDVIYKIKIKRKIETAEEKADSLIKFFTRKKLKFEIKENKLIVYANNQISQFLNLFKDKFKDILNLELEVKEEEKNNKTPQQSF
jgi:FKBP-type peptidyl-prolyl cis-trans isomerase 2